MKKEYIITVMILVVVLLITPFSNRAFAAGGQFGVRDLARYMDAFPIKSDFNIDRITKQGYRITHVDQVNNIEICTIYYGEDRMIVKVDTMTNKIINLHIDVGSMPAKDANFFYNGWLSTITSRYGNPTDEDSVILISSVYGSESYKYAQFKETGKYEYFFGGATVSPGIVALVLEIKAL